MPRPQFDELPFWERPDLTPYLIHLTKHSERQSAFDNLLDILRDGKVRASGKSGFIKGSEKATCFLDIPFVSLKYLLNDANARGEKPRYEPFGVVVMKTTAYEHGFRPVLYLSERDQSDLEIPHQELWRVVRLELSKNQCVSWLHEREWRCRGDFRLPSKFIAVLVENPKFAQRLQKMLATDPLEFVAVPKCILPLSVICQGLSYLSK